VLVIESNLEDALSIGEMLRATLVDEVGVRRRATLGEARGGLVAGDVAWVLLDLSLSDAPGLESVARLQQAAPDLPLVVLGGPGEEGLAVKAVHEGRRTTCSRAASTPACSGAGAATARSTCSRSTAPSSRGSPTARASGACSPRWSGLRMRLACGRAPRASRRASSEEVVRNGCDAVQGYFVCRPASAGALDDCLVHPPTHAAV
jgi:ActR/RegA family two-component response regulator